MGHAAAFSPEHSFEHQHGAYALVRDGEGRLLLIRGATGRWYLPGGRIKAGEGPIEALRREIAEECGWSAEIGPAAGRGEQAIFGGAVHLAATYWEARLLAPLGRAGEHETAWLPPREAAARLHRPSDRHVARTILPGHEARGNCLADPGR